MGMLWHLLKLHSLSLKNSLWQQLADKLVAALSASFFVALALYISQDFILRKMDFAQVMQDLVLSWFNIISAGFYGVLVGHKLRRERSGPETVTNFIREKYSSLSLRLSNDLLLLVMVIFTTLLVVQTFHLIGFITEASQALLWFGIALAISYTYSTFPYSVGRRSTQWRLHYRPNESKFMALNKWKLNQILWFHPTARSLLWGSLAGSVSVSYLAHHEQPLSLLILCALASGLLGAWSILLLCVEDLQQLWLERQAGVTDQNYFASLRFVCYASGLVTAFVGISAAFFTTSIPPLIICKIFAFTWIPLWIVPQIIMQIDPRHSLINNLLLIIGGLFLGTGIFMHFGVLILLPFIGKYCRDNMRHQFYKVT